MTAQEYASWGGGPAVRESQRLFLDAVWHEVSSGCCWDTERLGRHIWDLRRQRLAREAAEKEAKKS